MRKAASLLALLAVLALSVSCVYNPNSIPYQTYVYRALRQGSYEAYGGGIRYVLAIGSGDHEKEDIEMSLSLYRRSSQGVNEYESTPYVTYEGLYSHGWEKMDSAGRGWHSKYHVDRFDFKTSSDPDFRADDMDGYAAITYERSSAGTEMEDGDWGQAYFPRNRNEGELLRGRMGG